MSDLEASRPAAGAYPGAVLHFEGGPRVDLRGPLRDEDRRALLELDLGPTFAVLTAEHPSDDAPAALSPDAADALEREDVRRALRLEEHLVLHGVPYRRVDGAAPDGTRLRRCVAAALPRERAAALARACDQPAILWYDGRRFWSWAVTADAGSQEPIVDLPSP